MIKLIAESVTIVFKGFEIFGIILTTRKQLKNALTIVNLKSEVEKK